MKKCRALFVWPQRNSRRYRFVVPNTVWKHQLRPTEFVILSYLCYCQTHDREEKTISVEVIAKSVHVTAGTLKKHLGTLVDRRLITVDGFCAPSLQSTVGEKFFTLPNEIFLLRLLHSAFVVYAYLLLIEDRRTHTCHPSYNTIAAKTGLSKNTALKSVSVLVEMELIMVGSSSYFDRHGMKWKGNNLYTILPIRIAVEDYHQRQLWQLDLDTERECVRKQQEKDRSRFAM